MNRVIEIIVSPRGETRVETKGFAGPECRQASRFLETALGKVAHEDLTANYYLPSTTENRQQQRE